MASIESKIIELKKEKKAVILAHTYQRGEIQDIADYVGDSYGLSVQATSTQAEVIIFCGVQFMAETAAILNPDKRVVLAEPTAGCPMADMIDAYDLQQLKNQYPDYYVVCYVNSSAEVKALSDICCTSSNAVKIVNKIPPERGIIFVPDFHLGEFVKESTGRNMVLWKGFCPTHARIEPSMVIEKKKLYPEALVMVHPEAPKQVRDLADRVFSTGQMCSFVSNDSHQQYIVGTEIGILHTLRKNNPSKKFYAVDDSITCPNMRKGSLESVYRSLTGEGGLTIKVAEEIAQKARLALEKMLSFSR